MSQTRLHLTDGALHPHEHRPGDDGMSNIQFPHRYEASNGSDVRIIQPMTGVKSQSEVDRDFSGRFQGGKLLCPLADRRRVGVPTGVQLDRLGTGSERRLDLLRIRINEETYLDSRILASLDRLADAV